MYFFNHIGVEMGPTALWKLPAVGHYRRQATNLSDSHPPGFNRASFAACMGQKTTNPKLSSAKYPQKTHTTLNAEPPSLAVHLFQLVPQPAGQQAQSRGRYGRFCATSKSSHLCCQLLIFLRDSLTFSPLFGPAVCQTNLRRNKELWPQVEVDSAEDSFGIIRGSSTRDRSCHASAPIRKAQMGCCRAPCSRDLAWPAIGAHKGCCSLPCRCAIAGPLVRGCLQTDMPLGFIQSALHDMLDVSRCQRALGARHCIIWPAAAKTDNHLALAVAATRQPWSTATQRW